MGEETFESKVPTKFKEYRRRYVASWIALRVLSSFIAFGGASFFPAAALAQSPTCLSQAPVNTSVPAAATAQRVYAFGVQNTTSVGFATSGPNGTGDLQTVQGISAGTGTWYADVPLLQYDTGNPLYGTFTTSTYLSNSTFTNVLCGQSTWIRRTPSNIPATSAQYVYDANSRLNILSSATATSSTTINYDQLGNITNISAPVTPTMTKVRSFYPISGGPGTVVVIQGGPFQGALFAYFGGVRATTLANTESSIWALVPAAAVTGPISVVVPSYAPGASSTNFTVLATAADPPAAQPVITTVSPGTGAPPTAVTVTGTNFYPIAGQTFVRLGATQVAPTTLTNTSIGFSVPVNQGTDYVYVVSPYGTAKSPSPFVVPLPPITGLPLLATVPLTVGGASQPLSITAANSGGAYTFSGLAGSWMSLQLSALTTIPANANVNYSLYGPNNQIITFSFDANGQPVTIATLTSSSRSIHLPPLPASGSYTLVFNSGASTTVSMTAAVSVDPIAAFGSNTTVSIGAAGQSQRVQFTGVSGQVVVLDVTTLSAAPANSALTSTWLSPSALPTGGAASAIAGSTAPLVVNAGTTYGGLLLSAAAGVTGSAQLLFDTTTFATITVNSSAVRTRASPGQAMRLNVALTNGQPVSFALTNVTAAGKLLVAALFDPFGTVVNTNVCDTSTGPGNCSWDFGNPPVTGTYTLVLYVANAPTYSAKVTVSSDLTGTLTSGIAKSVNLTLPGQTTRLSFTGTGYPVLINVLNNTGAPSGIGIWAWTYPSSNPGGIDIANGTNNFGMLYWLPSISAGQTQTVQLTADDAFGGSVAGEGKGGTGSATVLLDQSTSSLFTVNALNAPSPVSYPVSTTEFGQAIQLPYNNTANQLISLKLSNVTTSNGTGSIQAVLFNAIDSSGSQWNMNYRPIFGSCPVSTGDCTLTVFESPFGIGPATLILYPVPSSSPAPMRLFGQFLPLPFSVGLTFSATVTLTGSL
jgi:hypothetical protein